MSLISVIDAKVAAGAREVMRRVAGWRRGPAVHTRGAFVAATLTVAGSGGRALGVPVLDEPGRIEVVARLSRGVSLPGRVPDVLGLAVRIPGGGDGGGDLDLLLSTASGLPGLGWLPVPRSGFTSGRYSTLAVYRTRAGALRLVADPEGPWVPADPESLPGVLERTPLTFRLRALRRGGGGRELGTLRVHGPADVETSFDPILNACSGLRPARWQRRLRREGYAGSREGRAGAPAGSGERRAGAPAGSGAEVSAGPRKERSGASAGPGR